jgi:DNA-binding Lrp family transcriptional regulator
MAAKVPAVKYYSLKQIAQKLGVSEATVIRRIETKKVRGVKKKYDVSGHLVFTVADLEKLKAHNQSLKVR